MTKIISGVKISEEDLKILGAEDKNFAERLKNFLLTCDNVRAGLDPYDENILFDPNRGHWDLWDLDQDGGAEFSLEENFVARDPADDVSSGIVAIDFGTSRTVVVYENEYSQILPLKVGSGTYRGDFNASDYENPTVIQFIDIENFLTAYYWREGRPFTKWSDVKVSHEAFENMIKGGSEKFYSFLTDLKYWCGSKTQFMLRDEKNFLTQLAPFADLAEDEINPLEIYAYYLGLYINNMQQERHIFLNYILSFPVTYEREIREKMRLSFEKGLKKSFPTALLANEAIMKKFSVQEGISEAAAYAITALQEYGFDPEGEEENYYAVFDFGGGTTDFDFGFLRESSSDRYDYLLIHFGENGDRTLGGENLLKLLAFELFKANQEKLIVEGGKIPFTWAADKKNFAGSEGLIKDSQEAHANMHALIEKIRPIWENPDSEDAKIILTEKNIAVNLFRDDGQILENFSLEITIDLEKILRERIKEGINNFFISMKEAFEKNSKNSLRKIKSLGEIDEISIFLAGNSSKSPIVNEIFTEFISPTEDTSLADDENPFANGRLKQGYELKGDYFMQKGSIYRRNYNGLEVWLGDMDNSNDQIVLSEAVKKIPTNSTSEKSPVDILFGFDDNNAPKFKIYPALGTKEAKELQKTRGIEIRNDLTAPTGKTGVAFGLLLSRAGGLIQTKHITPDSSKIPFSFYVGRNKKRKFKPIIDRNTKFNVWYPFIDAGDNFDIFYTNLPEAVSNQMNIQKAKRITIQISEPDSEKIVFIRAVKSNVIEYRIARNESELSDENISEKIELN